MLSKKIISGVIAVIMLSSFCTITAQGKTTDYKAYSATLDKTTYSGNDLGATYSKSSTTFKVWSPTAEKISVKLYETGSDGEKDAGYIKQRDMSFNEKTGVWSVTITGDYKNKYYTYLVTNGKTSTETTDIYAKACGVNGIRSMIVDLKASNPYGWSKDNHVTVNQQSDAKVWEVHVKDFSYSTSSGVSNANRGKYLAFTEEGTTLNNQGNISTCLDYLKELGINYVEINPFYDFGSVDETNSQKAFNWGYDPMNYNVPEGSYSSNPYDGNVRINECKQMIQALHNAGIGVIMDVVYNHTYTQKDSNFDILVPNYYYRMNSDGTYSNGSGCGNDTASEHLMYRKYMIDSVTYWAKEYHIDGFRFDLMGLHDTVTMNGIRESLDNLYSDGTGKKILMFGEAWNMSTAADDGTVLANQNNMSKLSDRIGAFDDTMRDAIKGSVFDGKSKGFIQDGSSRSNLRIGIEAQSNLSSGWASTPNQTVTYTSCHDNYALYDKLVLSIYGDKKDFRSRYNDLVEMNKLAAGIIYSSQGISFMQAGEEFCRSKDGDENSYKSDVNLNAIDWNNLEKFSDVVDYYKGMLKIRNAFSSFTDSTNKTANSLYYFGSAPQGTLGYTASAISNEGWQKLAVCFNGTDEEQTVTIEGENLPSKWVKVADNYLSGVNALSTVNGNKMTLSPHSAMIYVDYDSFNATKSKEEKGTVVVDYYDNATGEKLFTKNVTGTVGDNYSIDLDKNLKMSYTVDSKQNATGVFKTTTQHAKLKVTQFSGNYSTVTFRYVDEKGNNIAPSKALTNQEGQSYFTPTIPGVEGYSLDLDNLPDNGAGFFTYKNQEVVYKYTKTSTKDCIVNAIFISDSGEILDIVTKKGEKGQDYSVSEKEYSDYSLYEIPENQSGVFTKIETNIIFSYVDDSVVDTQRILLISFIGGGALLLGAALAYQLIRNRKLKKKYSIDIEE